MLRTQIVLCAFIGIPVASAAAAMKSNRWNARGSVPALTSDGLDRLQVKCRR